MPVAPRPGSGWRPADRRRPASRLIVLLEHLGKDELVAVPGDRANEARLARIVAEHAADGANRLAERAVGDDDVGPDAVEDVAAVHRLAPALDQEDQQIEVARDERPFVPVAQEHAAPRRKDEIAEAITRHGVATIYTVPGNSAPSF